MLPSTALQVVRDELILDGNARLNLATFVTTWMEPEAELLMADCFSKNMIDKDEYPRTAELERRCVSMLAHLWHADGTPTGCSTTGSSEACMLGGMALLWRWRAAAGARRRPGGPAQPGHGGQRPGLLGQVLPLLAGRAAAGADGAGPAAPDRPRGGRPVRREHHRRGRDPGLDHGRQLRAGGGHQRRPGPAGGRRRAGHPDSRRRRVRRVRRPVHPARPDLGLPAAAGGLDQRLRPQVRPGLPGRGLGHLAGRGGAARGPDLQGQLPGRARCPPSP